jgi:formylglycine-generating enzyme required for sulfatase activity
MKNKTKLEWQNWDGDTSLNWYEAMEYAKSLGEGWRLPTRAELIDAYDNNIQGFKSDYYWSSSTYAQGTDSAWGVNFALGYVYYSYKTLRYYVRCVRGVKLIQRLL